MRGPNGAGVEAGDAGEERRHMTAEEIHMNLEELYAQSSRRVMINWTIQAVMYDVVTSTSLLASRVRSSSL